MRQKANALNNRGCSDDSVLRIVWVGFWELNRTNRYLRISLSRITRRATRPEGRLFGHVAQVLSPVSALAITPQSAYTLFYSVRSAFIGSNREARQAGARQARTATASSVATTPDRTTGSRGFIPKSIDWKMRVAAKLITKPSPS